MRVFHQSALSAISADAEPPDEAYEMPDMPSPTEAVLQVTGPGSDQGLYLAPRAGVEQNELASDQDDLCLGPRPSIGRTEPVSDQDDLYLEPGASAEQIDSLPAVPAGDHDAAPDET